MDITKFEDAKTCFAEFCLFFNKKLIAPNPSPAIDTIRAMSFEGLKIVNEVSILLENVRKEQPIGHNALIREFFELLLQLTFMLKQDADERALCYEYCHYKEESEYFDWFIPTKDSYNKILTAEPRWGTMASSESIFATAGTQKQKYEDEMNDPRFALIRLKTIKDNWHWYTIMDNSIKKIKDLAKNTGFYSDYLTIYHILCRQTHANAVLANVEFAKLEPKIQMVMAYFTVTIKNFISIIAKYFVDNSIITKREIDMVLAPYQLFR
ncbi:MAG: DUF5677 domain-containing protein [Christensenellaceae bacterium]|nr:DUF5677 domain-containing protein [Christensenellaceae bacterium]